jgi:hypothetical protein
MEDIYKEVYMENDILVVKVNMFLKNKELEAVRQYILEQRKTGVIVLPLYCEAIMVPKDVEIKFEGVETDVDRKQKSYKERLIEQVKTLGQYVQQSK